MTDTDWVVLAFKNDRAGRPLIKFWGDQLYGVDVPECSLALPFGDVCSVYHVHRFDLGGFLLSPCVRLARLFIVVLAGRPFPLMFGV